MGKSRFKYKETGFENDYNNHTDFSYIENLQKELGSKDDGGY